MRPEGPGPVVYWPLAGVAAWLLVELLEGCTRHTSGIVRWPKQGWLAKSVRSRELGQRAPPSQLAPAKNQGKSCIAPTHGAFRPGRGWPVMGLSLGVILFFSVCPGSSPASAK